MRENRWRRAVLVCLAAGLVGLSGVQAERGRQAAGEAQVEVPLVALTFDDGPCRETTTALLDGLALREVPATFFLVGSQIPGNEDLVERMSREGHQVGIHTFDHVKVSDLSRGEYDRQISRTRALVEEIAGAGDYWLRPPYGLLNDRVASWADGPLILWSVDTLDWEDRNPQRITDQVLREAGDGDIILLHDIFDTSVEAALAIVDGLEERGCCFVTVEQLMAARGVTPECGRCYRACHGESGKSP